MRIFPIKRTILLAILILCTCIQFADSKCNDENTGHLTVVLNNNSNKIPLIDIDRIKIASINIGYKYTTVFDSILNKYQKVDSWSTQKYTDSLSFDALKDDLKFYNLLIIQLTDTYATDARVIKFIEEVEKSKNVIVTFSGTGKNLAYFDTITSPILWCTQSSPSAASYMAQAIFGGVSINNTLQKTYSPIYRYGLGNSIKKIRLGYSKPQQLGVDTVCLQLIDTIALQAINQKATPSVVVLVAKNGQIIYNKAFGNHTYGGLPTHIDDIYDLASVTKIAATTLGVMRLVEKQKINLKNPLRNYIARTKGYDKGAITLRELMLHEAGLVPFIPFYKTVVASDYSQAPSDVFTTKVAEHYYLRKNYFEEVMWPQMLKSRLLNRGKYVYSDLSMHFMKEVLENVTSERLDKYLSEQFYNPLGMKTAGFNPRDHFNSNQIIPTENDTTFRKSLLLGYVHDQGAAMLGGVAGNAGLFASANDLAILFQLFLNGGTYGGKKYFEPNTIQFFTSKQSKISRRGLGFDRRDPDSSKAYPSKLASEKIYGHKGYTGTCVWVDPKYNLIYIFLSNRIHPQVSSKLSELGIRGRILDVIYELIQQPKLASDKN